MTLTIACLFASACVVLHVCTIIADARAVGLHAIAEFHKHEVRRLLESDE